MQIKMIERRKSSKAGNFIVSVIIIVLVIITYKSMYSEAPDISEKYSNLDATTSAQYFIDQKLKCPSSADYNWDFNNCIKENDTTFILKGTVDASNAFGAKLRHEVSCKLIYLDHIEQMRVEDLIIE